MNRLIFFSVFLILVVNWPFSHALAEQRIPRLQVSPVPPAQDGICFTCALGEIGFRAQHGFVLFGVEMREKDGKEPTVNLRVADGATLGDALGDVLRQMPGYTVEVVSEHMINIYPQGAKDDARDPLNLRVEKFDFVNDRLSSLLRYPDFYMFDLKKRLVQRTEGPPSPIEPPSIMSFNALEPLDTLHLRNVTVRDILNRASEATLGYPSRLSPYCWSAMLHPDAAWTVGGTYSWRAFGSVPRDWKNYWKPAPATGKTE